MHAHADLKTSETLQLSALGLTGPAVWWWIIGITALAGIYCVWRNHLKQRAALRQMKHNCWNLQAVISHEIRAPLSSISKLLELASTAETPVSEQLALLQTVQASSRSLLALLDDMLTQSQLDSGKLSLSPQPTHLPSLVQELANIHQALASSKGLQFDLHTDYAISTLLIDQLKLRQILGNLLSNAIKFTPEGSVRLSVTSRKDGTDKAQVEIEIVDSGIGIPDAAHEALFTPYSPVGAAARMQFGGTGLGLYLSQRLTHLMGGEILISRREEKGTRIQLCFEFAPPLQALQPRTESPFHGVRALLAEDEPANQMLLKLQLEQLGLTVRCCSNGRQALREWARNGGEVLFCDLHMPELNGQQLINRIRRLEQRLNRPPLAIVTVSSTGQEPASCSGMDYCLYKPVSNTELLQALSYCLPGRQPPMTSPQHLQLDILHKLSQGDRVFEQNFIYSVLRSNRSDLAALLTAFLSRDLPQMAESLHRLLGVVRLLGNETITEHCLMLEKAIHSQQTRRIRRLLPLINMEIRAINHELYRQLPTDQARSAQNSKS